MTLFPSHWRCPSPEPKQQHSRTRGERSEDGHGGTSLSDHLWAACVVGQRDSRARRDAPLKSDFVSDVEATGILASCRDRFLTLTAVFQVFFGILAACAQELPWQCSESTCGLWRPCTLLQARGACRRNTRHKASQGLLSWFASSRGQIQGILQARRHHERVLL